MALFSSARTCAVPDTVSLPPRRRRLVHHPPEKAQDAFAQPAKAFHFCDRACQVRSGRPWCRCRCPSPAFPLFWPGMGYRTPVSGPCPALPGCKKPAGDLRALGSWRLTPGPGIDRDRGFGRVRSRACTSCPDRRSGSARLGQSLPAWRHRFRGRRTASRHRWCVPVSFRRTARPRSGCRSRRPAG